MSATFGVSSLSLGFADKTVREVCCQHNVDKDTFLQVVNFVTDKEYNYEAVSLPSIIGYLKQAHEYYLNYNLPVIRRKLIEAIDCSGKDELAMLILKFYDEYFIEVRKHMEHENESVFSYVEGLMQGSLNRNFTISLFAGRHTPISEKLKELKDVIIRYYPEKNNYQLNSVLIDILLCERDINSHCEIEDKLFIPAVKHKETQLRNSGQIVYSEDIEDDMVDRDKSDVLSDREKDIVVCVTKGMNNKEIADYLFLSVHTVAIFPTNCKFVPQQDLSSMP